MLSCESHAHSAQAFGLLLWLTLTLDHGFAQHPGPKEHGSLLNGEVYAGCRTYERDIPESFSGDSLLVLLTDYRALLSCSLLKLESLLHDAGEVQCAILVRGLTCRASEELLFGRIGLDSLAFRLFCDPALADSLVPLLGMQLKKFPASRFPASVSPIGDEMRDDRPEVSAGNDLAAHDSVLSQVSAMPSLKLGYEPHQGLEFFALDAGDVGFSRGLWEGSLDRPFVLVLDHLMHKLQLFGESGSMLRSLHLYSDRPVPDRLISSALAPYGYLAATGRIAGISTDPQSDDSAGPRFWLRYLHSLPLAEKEGTTVFRDHLIVRVFDEKLQQLNYWISDLSEEHDSGELTKEGPGLLSMDFAVCDSLIWSGVLAYDAGAIPGRRRHIRSIQTDQSLMTWEDSLKFPALDRLYRQTGAEDFLYSHFARKERPDCPEYAFAVYSAAILEMETEKESPSHFIDAHLATRIFTSVDSFPHSHFAYRHLDAVQDHSGQIWSLEAVRDCESESFTRYLVRYAKGIASSEAVLLPSELQSAANPQLRFAELGVQVVGFRFDSRNATMLQWPVKKSGL